MPIESLKCLKAFQIQGKSQIATSTPRFFGNALDCAGRPAQKGGRGTQGRQLAATMSR